MRYLPALQRMKIVDAKGNIRRFRPNMEQLEVINTIEEQEKAGKPVRLIILKARQMGISTVTEGIIFTRTQVIDNTKALIIAHETDSSAGLLEMTKFFWETSPWSKVYKIKWNSKKEMAWHDHRSILRIATAGNKNPGRSKTLQALHVSELAFWDNPNSSMLALNQAVHRVPNSLIVLESTANGIGNYFHERWTEAWDEGDSDYIPLFFPWQDFPEYNMPGDNLPKLSSHQLDAEERHLRSLGLADSRLYWRRWAIRNLCDNDLIQFHQEYPSNPEEAFSSTGTNVFSLARLREAYQPCPYMQGNIHREGPNYVRFIDDPEGELKIFRTPNPDTERGQYFIGEDSTYTITHDFCAIQVINRRTNEQVAIWRGRRDPYTMGEECAKLALYYNSAHIAVEANQAGSGTIGALVQMGYPWLWRNTFADKLPGQPKHVLGWHTSMKTKEWALGYLKKLLVDRKIIIHDKTTFMEMMSYIRLPGGKYGPAQGEGKGHDDTVMSLAIACLCSATGDPQMPQGKTLEEKLFGDKRNGQQFPTWDEQLLDAV